MSVPAQGGIWSASGWRGDSIAAILASIKEALGEHGITLSESACEVRAYVRSLQEYAEFNVAYKQYFGYNPPVRACVQTPLAQYCQVYNEGRLTLL